MPIIYNIYCDESCHLENDSQRAMALGAIWCPLNVRLEVSKRIAEIKEKHGLDANQEIKWTRVSPAKIDLYLDLIDYFFDSSDLHFRGLVIPDKTVLQHDRHNQSHDEWYYKMYFNLLKVILDNDSSFNIYLDIKDTLGGTKIDRLEEVLANDRYDFERKIVRKIQLIRSHEVQLIQLADLLTGALTYKHRGVMNSEAKTRLITRISERSGYSLLRNTLLSEDKFNLFIWQGANSEL